MREDVRRDMKLAFDLLPDRFTLTELQNVYEQIWDMELTTPNFRRKIVEYVEETDAYQSGERSDLPNCSHEGMMQGSRDYSVVD